MTNKTEVIGPVLYDTARYYVTRTSNAIGEDGEYGAEGYAVINKDTEVAEHTTIMLPGAIFQTQHFTDTLINLEKADDTPDNVIALAEVPTDDVVPH